MAELSREAFERARQVAIDAAPEGLSREQFDRYLSNAIDAEERGPQASTFAEGFTRSLADTGVRTLNGVVRGAASAVNPINWVKGPIDLAIDLASGGHGTAETLRAIASGDPDVGGEVIGALLTGGVAGRVLPKVPTGIRRVRGSAPYQYAAGVSKGALSETPLIAPVVKGAYRGLQDVRLDRAAERIGSVANRAKGSKAIMEYGASRNAALSADDVSELVQALREPSRVEQIGGLAGGRSSARGVVMEPGRIQTRSGDMVSTRPDKWGMTATFPEQESALALRGTSTRGPLQTLEAELARQTSIARPASRGVLTSPERARLQRILDQLGP